MKFYQIKDWGDHYENSRSREIDLCNKCSLPNKQDGLGYGRLLRLPDGEALYGAFVAVVMVASKQSKPRCGYLTTDGLPTGCPLTADDLSIKTQFKAGTIQGMLDALSNKSIGWIELVETTDEVPPDRRPTAGEVPPNCQPAAEERKKEGKKEVQPEAAAAADVADGPEKALSPKRQLTDAWCAEYQVYHGRVYLFQGAKDGRGADTLIKLGIPIPEIMNTAKAAWGNPGGFNCKQAASLAGFVARFNEIQAELNALTKPQAEIDDARADFDEDAYQEEKLRWAIETHNATVDAGKSTAPKIV